ncbi:MAG: hypothetical protein SGJ24_07290 [Chloroflexota bacterium]|nr:hypothetical protein [Chloroflexota bacterium]
MMIRLCTLLIAACVLSACQLTQIVDPTPTPTLIAVATESTPDLIAALPTTEPTATPIPTATTAPVTAASNDILLGGVLAWIGGRDAVNTSGRMAQIALIGSDGTVSTLFETPDTGRPARACGERATSPDGDLFAFYVGADRGTLYMMRGATAPIVVREVEYLACLGMGTFRYSADGGRFAFIDYTPGAARDDFADGTMRLYDSTSLAQVVTFEDVIAFDLGTSDALFVRFYANEQGVADEAAVLLWDGSTERELATLLPTEDGCRFTSAQIVRGGEPLIIMGQRCTRGDTRTHWQLYDLNIEDGAVNLIQSDAQPGAFLTFARTNTLIASPDGETVYFTVPDGVAANTVAVAAINRADNTITIPVARQAVMPSFSGTTNATPRFSPDGRWLITVVTSPDADNQLVALELDAPDRAPLTLAAGTRGDSIPAFDIGLFSDRAYLIAGGADNALFDFDLNSGASRRIARGRYVESLIASGDRIAVLERRQEESPVREFLDLVLVEIDDGAKRTIFEGQPIPGGGSTIAVPLAWR